MIRWLCLTLLVLLAGGRPAAAGHPWGPVILTIDPDSLEQLAAQGRPVLVVDVRAHEAFQPAVCPGRSIPLTALAARQRELPPDRLVVLYGADSVDEAAAAFRYLRSTGRTNIVVLEGGFAAWRTGGYRVER
jgi:rhodanese-related sulfurtransferase